MKIDTTLFFAGVLSISTLEAVLRGKKTCARRERFYFDDDKTIEGRTSQANKAIQDGYVLYMKVPISYWQEWKWAIEHFYDPSSLLGPIVTCPTSNQSALIVKSAPPLIYVRSLMFECNGEYDTVRLLIVIEKLEVYGSCDSSHELWVALRDSHNAGNWTAEISGLKLEVTTNWLTSEKTSSIQNARILRFDAGSVNVKLWDGNDVRIKIQMSSGDPLLQDIITEVQRSLLNSNSGPEFVKQLVEKLFY